MKRKYLALGLVLIMVFAGAALAATTFITIGSGGVGGTYYPLGGVMAELLTKGGVDIKATSRSTAASKENCRLVASNKAQIGMTMGSTLYQAYTGTEAFKDDGRLECGQGYPKTAADPAGGGNGAEGREYRRGLF